MLTKYLKILSEDFSRLPKQILENSVDFEDVKTTDLEDGDEVVVNNAPNKGKSQRVVGKAQNGSVEVKHIGPNNQPKKQRVPVSQVQRVQDGNKSERPKNAQGQRSRDQLIQAAQRA